MSASTSPAHSTTKQHVPAWKRLGLKLKYAKDTAEGSAPVPEQPAQHRLESSAEPKAAKRQRDEDGESGRTPKSAKKRKTVNKSSREDDQETSKAAFTSSASFAADTTAAIPSIHASQALPTKVSPHSGSATECNITHATPKRQDSSGLTVGARRKSVAFTPDTKADDGFSAQRIFKEGPSDEPTASTDQEPEQPSPSSTKSTKKEKKRSKQQQAAPVTNGASATQTAQAEQVEKKEVPEYIRYLQQYYSEKASWKFNKNKQKDVLKNLFNIYRIPPEHNPALVAYIAGLQGIAVQHRVIEDAEDVLKKLLEKQERGAEIEGMDSQAARKAAYEAALQREIEKLERSGAGRSEYDEQQLQEIRQDVERGKRADAVLAELLSKELAPPARDAQSQPSSDHSPSLLATNGASSGAAQDLNASNGKPKRKKRKTRTEVSSSESSSSSSESEGE
ncbi:hypothetical protein LTR85_006019 [Meristemomyces frigidus]|nr:hypothetical protein LTR85_006019 [Meristemomyces frigidus]